MIQLELEYSSICYVYLGWIGPLYFDKSQIWVRYLTHVYNPPGWMHFKYTSIAFVCHGRTQLLYVVRSFSHICWLNRFLGWEKHCLKMNDLLFKSHRMNVPWFGAGKYSPEWWECTWYWQKIETQFVEKHTKLLVVSCSTPLAWVPYCPVSNSLICCFSWYTLRCIQFVGCFIQVHLTTNKRDNSHFLDWGPKPVSLQHQHELVGKSFKVICYKSRGFLRHKLYILGIKTF